MPAERRLYVGPALKRTRRELGLTQAEMAADLDVSASYIALLERNHRPLSAEVLMRLAQTYKLDMAALSKGVGADEEMRLRKVLSDPLFDGIDLPESELSDVVTNFPGVVEALQRLHATYRKDQLTLADRTAGGASSEATPGGGPVSEARRFLEARRNTFPRIDDAAEALAEAVARHGGVAAHLQAEHDLRVRRLPARVMVGAWRRLDLHRREIVLDDRLDAASHAFQLALQLVYLELGGEIEAALAGGEWSSEDSRRLAASAVGGYAAAALLMPYEAFLRAAEACLYDVEALGRRFGVSFEQTAHRLTTLQKPGREGVPFFMIRVDAAGNVSKRRDGTGAPFARHGGGCPLWSVHHVFRTPREVVVQWLELPDGERFFSIARTVTSGGGAFGAARVDRALALGCSAEHAHRLVYTRAAGPGAEAAPLPEATPIGVTCRLCQRLDCLARAAPPLGRDIQADDVRRTSTAFGASHT